jgi:hypothetical protein
MTLVALKDAHYLAIEGPEPPFFDHGVVEAIALPALCL